MSILIADSGSSTTDWAFIADEVQTQQIKTGGINPVHQHDESIQHVIADELCPALQGIQPLEIYFYGAGCIDGKTNERLATLLADYFPNATIHISSDLLGAARSLCGNEAGIAGILGTGANSCYYDGTRIVNNVPPLGYILGDEGSGAAMGKAFLQRLLRGQLPDHIAQAFFTEYDTDYSRLIDRIYRQPAANRYLAGISPFIAAHIADEKIYNIVYDALLAYFEQHIMQYDYRHHPVHLTGSIAHHYADIVRRVAAHTGVTIERITAAPIEGLAAYHSHNNQP